MTEPTEVMEIDVTGCLNRCCKNCRFDSNNGRIRVLFVTMYQGVRPIERCVVIEDKREKADACECRLC